MRSIKYRFLLVLAVLLTFAPATFAQDPTPSPEAALPPPRKGKAPIIIIPGLTGSELVHRGNGKVVWFRSTRVKDDDIRLPITLSYTSSRDDLYPRDIMRGVKILKFLPEIEIYERLINALETRGGYREAKWNAPGRDGDRDTFYVFAYDWRRDNVENARNLVVQVEALKRRLRKPNLKFNIIGHSMGGLIARYAAMYGNSDIPAGTVTPTWAGARHFSKIFMLGTPNYGTVSALDGLLNGYSYLGGGLNLPFFQNVTEYDTFTLPSLYQLLPHAGTFKAYDETLKPMEIDVMDPAVWETYGWGIWKDDAYKKKYSAAEAGRAKTFFRSALARAKRFQLALDARSPRKSPVTFYVVGGDCKETPVAVVLRRSEKKDKWITQFKADSFTNSEGTKITAEQLKPLIFGLGDSVVLKDSLLPADTANGARLIPVSAEIFQCEGHTKLVTSSDVQDRILGLLLNGQAPVANK